MYSDYSPQQQDKFTYEKMFFPNLYNQKQPPEVFCKKRCS